MPIPIITEACVPPPVLGAATLTAAALQGAATEALRGMIAAAAPQPAAALFDMAIAEQLGWHRAEAMVTQQAALAACPLYRVRGGWSGAGPRVLALCVPGDLMANTPLDFITNALDIRLDLLFVGPGGALPAAVPEHDLAFFAAAESDPLLDRAMRQLHAAWPRPVVNDPARLPVLRRDQLCRALAGIPGLLCPTVVAATRAALQAVVAGEGSVARLLAGGPASGTETLRSGDAACLPVLLRPVGSHAGQGLCRIEDPAGIAACLAACAEPTFFLGAFVDYRSADGLFRKYRVVVIDGAAYPCHMAVSEHWMVHYLNAGMAACAAKRDEEARALAGFDAGFGARHAAALAALHGRLGLDYYAIDCAEAPDGRLLVFEADTAAIVHALDPPALFGYKQAPMQRLFAAFAALLSARARPPGQAGRAPVRSAQPKRPALQVG